MNDKPIANSATVTGLEDSDAILVTLSGTTLDAGETILSFMVTGVPANGTLYADAAMTIVVNAGDSFAASAGTTTLWFKPAADFNGEVQMQYTATESAAVGADAAPAANYYLTIDGLNGGSLVKGHEGSFAIADFNIDIEALTSWTKGGGASVGKPNPGPLVIAFDEADSIRGLIGKVISGTSIPHVQIEGVTADGETVYDLRLENVFVTRIEDATGGDHLELVYKAVSLTTRDQGPAGTLGAEQTVSWDIPAGQIGSTKLGAATADGTIDTAPQGAYFMTIDGMNGGSEHRGYEGTFELADFSFDIEAETSWTKGSGASVGKPNPGSLIVELEDGVSLAALIGKIGKGEAIPLLQIEGAVNDGSGRLQTAYDLRLEDVFVTKITDSAGSDRFELVYKAMSLTTRAQDATGKLTAAQTVSWDVSTGVAGTQQLQDAVPSKTEETAFASQYFLTVDGLNGGVAEKGYEGSFAVASFSFDLNAEVSTASTGSGVGKTFPGPLRISLEEGGSFDKLISFITTGKAIPHLQLQGVTSDGDAQRATSYDLRLEGVFITRILDDAGGDSIELVYKGMSLTTRAQGATGELLAPTTVSWDVPTGTVGNAELAAATAGVSTEAAAHASRYYLTIDGMNGGSTAEKFKGSFDIPGFSYDIEALSSWTSGASVGKPNPGPVYINLEDGHSMGLLIKKIATGSSIAHVQIEGVTADGDTVYDLRLGGVFITQLGDGSAKDGFALVYREMSLTTRSISGTGALGPQHTVSWGVDSGQVGNGQLGEATPALAGDGAPASHYFMTIDGMNGGSTAEGFEGAYENIGFSFDIAAQTSWVKGGGASVGKPNPGPLIIDLEDGSALNGLIGKIGTGHVIDHVQIEGVTGGENSQKVYDLRLEGVYVAKVIDSSGGDQLELVYKAMSLTTRGMKDDGSLGTAQTVSWNIPEGTSGSGGQLGEAQAGTGAESAPVSRYYLTIDGMNGGVSAKGHEGSFSLGDFSFDIEAATNWTSGGGAAVGKPNPGPLSIGLEDGAGLGKLVGKIGTGIAVPHLQIEGVTPDGKTVYDLRLEHAFVTRVSDGNHGDRLEFVYREMSLTTRSIDTSGRLGTEHTISWDVSTGAVGTAKLAEATPSKLGSGTGLTSDPGTVTIHVDPVNDAPTGSPTAVLTDGIEDTPYTVTAAQLLKGFSDIDGDPLKIVGLASSSGTVTDNGDGTFTVNPALNDNGLVTLTYGVSDGTAALLNQQRSFTLAPVNDAAVIGGDTGGTITEDAAPDTLAGQLTISDVDSPAAFQPVAPGTVSDKGYGTVALESSGAWVYTLDNASLAVDLLNGGQSLKDSFTAVSADGTTQVVSVTIAGVSDSGNVVIAADGQTLVQGSGGADTILLGDSNRMAVSGGGNDRVIVMPPGANHVLAGGGGTDTLDLSQFDTGVIVSLKDNLMRFAGVPGVSVVTGFENVTGGTGDDILTGDAGANRLSGGAGADRIEGDRGADMLSGGSGPDTFVFDDNDSGSAPATRDVILDFHPGADRIDLSAVDAQDNAAGNQSFLPGIALWNGLGNPFALNAPGTIAYHQETVNGVAFTVVDLNTDRDAAADMQIALKGVFSFGDTGSFIL